VKVALATAMVGLAPCGLSPAAAREPVLNENCVVSLLNRTAPVNADGIWVLPNVPAGIGQVRLRATCVEDGVTIGGQSDYFTVPADGVVRVDEIHFDGAAPVPERLTISASSTTLTEPGQVLPLAVLALYPDGTSADVTPAAAGTNYVVSNPAVATLSPDGELTAVASGTVIVSALNEGASGFLRLQVVLSGDSDGDGIPDDVEVSLGLDPNDPVDALLDPDGDGLTNGDEVAYGTDPNDPDTDGDGLADAEEASSTGTDPALFDTDGDGLSDGLEIATGSNPLDPGSYNLAQALATFDVQPANFVLNTNTVFPGEAFVALTAQGTLIDGNPIDLTSSARGTGFSSSDLLICNFGAGEGVVFAGAEGPCTITATNSGFVAVAEGLVQEFTPRPVSSLDLPSYGNSVAVQGDWVFVAGGPGGLHVVDASSRLDPMLVTTLPLPGNANDVVLDGDLAYVAAGDAGLQVVDVSVPATPVLVGTVDTPGSAIALRVVQDLVYVADGAEGLQVISVADPTLPVVLGSWDTPGEANGLAVAGGLAVVSTKSSPLEVVDVSTASAPVGLATLPLGELTFDVEILGSLAYVATSKDLRVVDLSDPLVPADGGSFGAGIWMIDLLAVDGNKIFTTQVEPSTRMPMFDLRADPAAPFFAGLIQFQQQGGPGGDGLHLAADDLYVYMTATTNFEMDSKPGTTGSTRLLIGEYAPLEDLAGQPPVLSLLEPEDGADVTEGTFFDVVLDVTDDIRVLDTSLWVDGEEVARDDLPPYRFAVEAPPAPATLLIGATARDFGGNRGEATPVEVHVQEGLGTTSVVGSVVTDAGLAAAGASVFTSLGGSGLSAADGSFRLDGLPATASSLVAFASADDGGTEVRGRSGAVPLVPGGLTDVGTIVLRPVGAPYPGPRSAVGFRSPPVEALATGDFDQDGVPDLVTVARYSPKVVAIHLGRGDGRFEQRQELPGGSDPNDVAVADLNQDGFLDLVVPDGSLNGVEIYLGQGDGTFSNPTSFSTGTTLTDVSIGDIDRDQVLDLVLAGTSASGLTVMIGRGDGTFEAPYVLSSVANPDRLELADFDADGNLDIVTERNLTVLFGNGDGTFQQPIELSPEAPSTYEGRVYFHRVGDLDGDGLPDIFAVVADLFLHGEVTSFLSRGDGTFGKVTVTVLSAQDQTVALGDFNADGHLDAIVKERDFNSVYAARPFLGDGTGAFLEGALVYAGDLGQISPVLLADFDRDGVDDLVTGGESGVSVFSAVGDGGFRTYLRDRQHFINTEGKIFSADLDVDGIDDLIVSRYHGLSYFIRQPDGSLGDPVDLALSHYVSDIVDDRGRRRRRAHRSGGQRLRVQGERLGLPGTGGWHVLGRAGLRSRGPSAEGPPHGRGPGRSR